VNTQLRRQNATAESREFTSAQTHGFVHSDHSDVEITSDGLGWTSTHVAVLRERPYQRTFAPCPHTMVAFVLSGPAPVRRTLYGTTVQKDMLPGSFGIVPGGASFDARLDLPLKSLHVYVRQELLEEVAQDMTAGDPESLEIIPRMAAFDPLLEQLALGICAAAQQDTPSPAFYSDYLARAFAARLVQNHSSIANREIKPASSQGLAPRQLRLVTEFIDANLATPLSLGDLANSCKMSPGHFARLFKTSTGLAPYQYVIRRRVERAQQLLTETNTAISSIATECGFAHQVHLTQSFRRITGATPAAYRKSNRN
jgi:AraC family transcriptional regulator